MDQEVMRTAVASVTSIIGPGILSVLVSKHAQTLGLVQNLSTGLAQDISAATGPVTSTGYTAPNYIFAQSSTYA